MNVRKNIPAIGALVFIFLSCAADARHYPSGHSNSPAKVAVYSQRWDRSDLPPEFAAFKAWTVRYLAAAGPGLTPQIPAFSQIREGLRLANQRKLALEAIIKSNPEEAISLCVPASVREKLPPEIVRHLETRWAGIGEYSVVADLPTKGSATQSVDRVVRLGGKTFHAYTYGRRLTETTKIGVPLHGIEVYGVFALADSCLRELETDEIPAKQIGNAKSRANGPKLSSGPVLAEAGEKIYRFTSRQQLMDAEAQLESAESALSPYPVRTADQILEAGATVNQKDIQAASTGWTTGNKNVLVIRVDFSDLPGDPVGVNNTTPISGGAIYTAPYVQDVIDSTVAPFYQHSSYGLTSLTNMVTTQLYRMPQTAAYYSTTGFPDQLHVDARSAAAADYDLANYDRIIVLFSDLNPPLTSRGFANVGGPNVWIIGAFTFGLVAHELGHTYGLAHAAWWAVNDGNPISTSGYALEYGDVFDTMGGSGANDPRTDFNPYFKNILGWISDSQVSSITTSGTYRINRFDDALASGILALKIPKDAGKTYWISCRRNFTTNASMQHGAYIIWAYDPESYFNYRSALLDMTTPGDNAEDAALGIGATFTDGVLGVSFEPVGEGGSGSNQYLDVQVTFPPPPPLLPGLGPFNPSDARVTAPFVINGTTVSQPVDTGPTTGGALEFLFNVPETADYEVSALMNCPDGGSNSVYINIDTQPTDPTMIWDVPITSGLEARTAAWRGSGTSTPEFDPKIWHLTVGEHLFVIRGREANTVIGPITIVPAPTPPPTPTPTPTPGPVLVTYEYTGSHYTYTNAPTTPGFTLDDYMTATVIVNRADWGTMVGCIGDLHSGPWSGADPGRITTDSMGNVLAWALTGSGPGLDLWCGGASDGSGEDNLAGDRPSGGQGIYAASVEYQAGSRDPANCWVMIPHPGVIISRNSSGDFVVHFEGTLQQSSDLMTWTDVPGYPSSPLVISKSNAPQRLFLRVLQEQ